ncbi:hypothetical protein [Isoptericola variabilis]|uniref:hypothetical protein n=1 Tax=Isoptericola variabilis TaxID=139208 RepID=UPI0002F57CFE|nr:hypothetical protein [Isoptericola variabilis]TWH31530.1 hypothetical protein L600_002300000220 [Isoptericola variabilis J7]
MCAALPAWFDVVGVAARNADARAGLAASGLLGRVTDAHVNPFRPARLPDDELSIAAMLARTAAHVRDGAAADPSAL